MSRFLRIIGKIDRIMNSAPQTDCWNASILTQGHLSPKVIKDLFFHFSLAEQAGGTNLAWEGKKAWGESGCSTESEDGASFQRCLFQRFSDTFENWSHKWRHLRSHAAGAQPSLCWCWHFWWEWANTLLPGLVMVAGWFGGGLFCKTALKQACVRLLRIPFLFGSFLSVRALRSVDVSETHWEHC